MKQPTPAIVTQAAVRRLPRLALWLLGLAYVLPGFIARSPWKREDITSLAYMVELARSAGSWWQPLLGGLAPDTPAPLGYWLGAGMVWLAPDWLAPELAARIPFVLLLAVTLLASWKAIYYLACCPLAQPLPFAFGGEAGPLDYARSMADGGLLALIACLGLAQLSHETTPALSQLCFTALLFYAGAALPYQRNKSLLAAAIGLFGLSLAGAPGIALVLGISSSLLYLWPNATTNPEVSTNRALALLALTLLAAALAWSLQLWRWQLDWPGANWRQWQGLGRLLMWFNWPAWPLALWALWRWRGLLLGQGFASRHLWLPLSFALTTTLATLLQGGNERLLLLGLPALAALAAFALPTLKRSLAALIDWFAVLFFSTCALVIWVVWLSMQTGIPAKPALNVAKLLPGFVPDFSLLPFLIALAASLIWAWLVFWRIGRHRAALWKSMVLSASGATLCWLLLMTLCLSALDYARSYQPMVQQALKILPPQAGCVATLNLRRSQIAAFALHSSLQLMPAGSSANCRWLIVNASDASSHTGFIEGRPWLQRAIISHPADRSEKIYIFERQVQ